MLAELGQQGQLEVFKALFRRCKVYRTRVCRTQVVEVCSVVCAHTEVDVPVACQQAVFVSDVRNAEGLPKLGSVDANSRGLHRVLDVGGTSTLLVKDWCIAQRLVLGQLRNHFVAICNWRPQIGLPLIQRVKP